jgi:hypothetical protein
MMRTIKLSLTAKEVKDAITEYCVNTSGLLGDKAVLIDIRIKGTAFDSIFGSDVGEPSYTEVEFTES